MAIRPRLSHRRLCEVAFGTKRRLGELPVWVDGGPSCIVEKSTVVGGERTIAGPSPAGSEVMPRYSLRICWAAPALRTRRRCSMIAITFWIQHVRGATLQ